MKQILIILVLAFVISIQATVINLKYSSVDTSEAPEVEEIISYYKNALAFFENMDRAKMSGNEKVLLFKSTLKENELKRFLYLDSYVNSRYPEFYKEFIFINSFKRLPVQSKLYSEEDTYSLSIYPRKFIEPYFNDNIRPENILPSVGSIRWGLWKSFNEDNPEYSLLGPNPFDKWAVVKFLNTEEVKIKYPLVSCIVHSECIVIDSENINEIGETFKIAITMFGEDEKFEKDKSYLINFGYMISHERMKNLTTSSIDINDQMRFVSQNFRVYSLTKDGIIEKVDREHASCTSTENYYEPLENYDFKTSGEVISFIKDLRNKLKSGSEK